jgi:hypothetical protein
MFGAFYFGQSYPAQAPDYPPIVYTPTYVYVATVPAESRSVLVKYETRTAVVPKDRLSARPAETRIAIVPQERRTTDTER